MPARNTLKAPTRRRQQLLLYFLEWSGRGLTRTELQKLLLIYTMEKNSKHYAFVPYQYGGYSFQCERDLHQLEKAGWVRVQHERRVLNAHIENESWASIDAERFAVREWIADWKLRGNALTAESYRRYPYYAIRSTVKRGLGLSTSELTAINEATPQVPERGITVFTMGYEGLHLEDWINKLIENSMTAVCDVRRNPWSRKYWFSRSQLENILPRFGIGYYRFPALGISSSDRRELNTPTEYDALFKKYRRELPQKTTELAQLQQVIKEGRRIVLICFEACHEDCHRGSLSEYLHHKYNYEVRHL